MRRSSEGGDIVDIVNELEGRLNDVRATLAVQDRSLEAAASQMGDLKDSLIALRSAVAEVEAALSGETRTLREILSNQSHHLEVLDSKLSQIEAFQRQTLTLVEDRLRTLNQQVTTAVGAMVVVIAVAILLLVVLR